MRRKARDLFIGRRETAASYRRLTPLTERRTDHRFV